MHFVLGSIVVFSELPFSTIYERGIEFEKKKFAFSQVPVQRKAPLFSLQIDSQTTID